MSVKGLRIDIDPELHLLIKIKSAETSITIAEYVRARLWEWVEEEPTAPQSNEENQT